jgi:hypothetical protein
LNVAEWGFWELLLLFGLTWGCCCCLAVACAYLLEHWLEQRKARRQRDLLSLWPKDAPPDTWR